MLRCSRRALAALMSVGLLFGLVTVTVGDARPASATGGETSRLLSLLNGSRASSGLGPLAVNGQLSAKAQGWANHMAATGTLSHSSPSSGITANWTRLGENVGVGSSPDAVHQAFMASSAHRGNILDRGFQYVGVGAAWRGSDLYVAEEFMQTSGGAPPASPAPRVSGATSSAAAVGRASRGSTGPRAAAPAAAPVLVPAGFAIGTPSQVTLSAEPAYQVWMRWLFCQQLQVCPRR